MPEGAHLSRTRLARLIAGGCVRLNGVAVTDARARVAEGDRVEVELPEAAEIAVAAQDIQLDVIFEDDELIVVNKPAGMVVHPAPGAPDHTLVNALLWHCGASLSGVGGEKRPGIVHRIDKDTSGLLVAAKTDRAHHGLASQFERHTAERRYQALVHGVPDAADARLRGLRGVVYEAGNVLCITTRLARHRTDRQRQAVFFQGGRHAVTRARVAESFGKPPVAALLDCWLETGRTHQIRVHMAYAGHALVGDPVYGRQRSYPAGSLKPGALSALRGFGRQALHAAVLGFRHPVSGDPLRFEAPLPVDMSGLLGELRQ